MKNFLVYILAFLVSFSPVQYAWSNPVAAVVTLASNPVVRAVASDIVVDVIARGFASNDPFYKSKGTISKAKYKNFLKTSGGKYAVIVSLLSAAGFMLVDGVLSKPEALPEGDVPPEEGIVWNIRNKSGATISEAAWSVVSGLDYIVDIEIVPYKPDPSREGFMTVNYKLSNGNNWAGSGDTATRVSCQYAKGMVSTCQPDFKPSLPSRPATEQEIDSEFFSYVETLSNAEKLKLFSPDSGTTIYPELTPEINPLMPPKLPNGSPLPSQGDELWTYADWINRGVAQQSNPNADYYVPPASWDIAYHLANSIAVGDSKVIDLNTGESSTPDPNPGTGTDTSPTAITGVVEVSNLGGIESRIDTTNQSLESIHNVLNENFTQTKVPETNVFLDGADSFWERRYKDGITGVFNKNLEALKKGELYQWISGFSIRGSARKPHFEICLEPTEYYEVDCINLDLPDHIWTFLRSAMMLGAAIYCRKLIIG
ncbi:hypothetical protein ND926_12215 [Vibrio diabolicus]|uniref:hypothetical protein n=1 Tax=Vibrio harveyi group TaxID=717610 RepID=UPI00054429BC|nr:MULTISPECIES: hypothetical protein [Vibrio harveyi group]KHF13344.1 hypothetical protein PO80_18730 [Vibrio parahaemolyticus]MCS0338227.1 hypothetical protein [Vibrio diabolicus]OTV93744.1 hypothetical protein BA740_12905 [Vibrio parahaemolyticus]OTV93753.1 hypothetical protein BA740_12950 [Vibrio parahaemolyticus]OTW03510.1 hypothetical protein BA739_14120 [Vibrio parahaemolyticus]